MAVRLRRVAAVLVCLVSCAVAYSVLAADIPWYGSSESDLARPEAFAGKLLRIRARFVRVCEGPAPGKSAGRKIIFLVEAAGGEVMCRLKNRGEEAEMVRGMRPGTPLVIYGRLDSGRNVFDVKRIAQGWGRTASGEGR